MVRCARAWPPQVCPSVVGVARACGPSQRPAHKECAPSGQPPPPPPLACPAHTNQAAREKGRASVRRAGGRAQREAPARGPQPALAIKRQEEAGESWRAILCVFCSTCGAGKPKKVFPLFFFSQLALIIIFYVALALLSLMTILSLFGIIINKCSRQPPAARLILCHFICLNPLVRARLSLGLSRLEHLHLSKTHPSALIACPSRLAAAAAVAAAAVVVVVALTVAVAAAAAVL